MKMANDVIDRPGLEERGPRPIVFAKGREEVVEFFALGAKIEDLRDHSAACDRVIESWGNAIHPSVP
jgi:hypothetical protein